MDRKTFYYRQKVTDGELNGAFADAENAIWKIMVDLGYYGVLSGLVGSENSPQGVSVNVTAGVAYNQAGRRMALLAPQVVALDQDFSLASTAVAAPGNERILSVFLRATRANSDPRVDGNGANVFFQNAESVAFYVVAGTEAALNTAVAPALQSDKILLFDVKRVYNDTTIATADISFARTQRNPSLQATIARYADHVAGILDKHNATDVNYAGSPTFFDGTAIGAGSVEATIDSFVTLLAGAGASAKLGAAAFTTPNASFNLSAGSVQSQLRALATRHDGPVIETVTSITTNIVVATGDGRKQILADTTGAALSVTLPPAAANAGRVLRFTDKVGKFGTNALTIVRNASEKIGGVAANAPLTADWGSYTLFCDGTDWYFGGS